MLETDVILCFIVMEAVWHTDHKWRANVARVGSAIIHAG